MFLNELWIFLLLSKQCYIDSRKKSFLHLQYLKIWLYWWHKHGSRYFTEESWNYKSSLQGLCLQGAYAATGIVLAPCVPPTPSPYRKGFGLFLLSTETWHYGSTKVTIYAVHKAGKFLTPCIKVWETWMFSGGFLRLPFYFIFSEGIGARQIVRQNFLESSLEQHLKCVILGAFGDFCITKCVPSLLWKSGAWNHLLVCLI